MLLKHFGIGCKAALLASVGLFAAGAAAASWQDIPDKIVLQTVGDKLSVNGVPMSVRAFNTDLPAEEALQLVQSAWERNKDRTSVTRTNMPPWTVLNQSNGNAHRSFQIKPSRNGGFEGFVALTSPAQARVPKAVIALPPEVTAVQIVDSVDNGRSSQQIVAVSTRSADATSAALESSLRADGWQRHVMKKQPTTVVFAANRNGQELDAIISTEMKGSLMMINIVERVQR